MPEISLAKGIIENKRVQQPAFFFVKITCKNHGGEYELTPDIYRGLYDGVNDLLGHCLIDGKALREKGGRILS